MINWLKTYWKAFLLVFLLILAYMGISWLLTVAVVKILCWCFSLHFSWKIVTGIWIIWLILSELARRIVGV